MQSDTLWVKKARKSHLCCWCHEAIEEGSRYAKWTDFDEGMSTSKLHPECFEVMQDEALYWGYDFEWTIGSYPRGQIE